MYGIRDHGDKFSPIHFEPHLSSSTAAGDDELCNEFSNRSFREPDESGLHDNSAPIWI